MPYLGTGRIKWLVTNAAVFACLAGAVAMAQYGRKGTPMESAAARAGSGNAAQETTILTDRLALMDSAFESAIREGVMPGAVVLVGRSDDTLYFKAYGNRALKPELEPMTTETIFDLSSLTKVVATTPSIMLLVEDGLLRLGDRVSEYLPRFKGDGKNDITVRQLLTHYSGLPADFDLSKKWSGYEASLEELWRVRANSPPGEAFVYSDINFIALGEIVRVLSGKRLDEFAGERIFGPLQMTDTCFRPSRDRAGRIAPTETRRSTLQYLHGAGDGESMDSMIRGEVHDPTAWRMGGVAGHAGLFSSAKDLAVYARMLLKLGTWDGRRLMSPLTVKAMTSPQSPPGSSQIRGYGWDIRSDYSSPLGDIFMDGYGHTGFTGVSLWVHPATDTFIVILSNRVHPDGGKNMNHLRSVVANIVASALSSPGNRQ